MVNTLCSALLALLALVACSGLLLWLKWHLALLLASLAGLPPS